mgnify:CR=1 FL=1
MAERAQRERTTDSPARPRIRTGTGHRLFLGILAVLCAPPAFAQDADVAPADDDITIPSALAQFTTAVENREPVDQVTFVANDARKIMKHQRSPMTSNETCRLQPFPSSARFSFNLPMHHTYSNFPICQNKYRFLVAT